MLEFPRFFHFNNAVNVHIAITKVRPNGQALMPVEFWSRNNPETILVDSPKHGKITEIRECHGFPYLLPITDGGATKFEPISSALVNLVHAKIRGFYLNSDSAINNQIGTNIHRRKMRIESAQAEL